MLSYLFYITTNTIIISICIDIAKKETAFAISFVSAYYLEKITRTAGLSPPWKVTLVFNPLYVNTLFNSL